MVLPLIDEDKPKCYLCHEMFKNIEELRDHQLGKHKEYFQSHKSNLRNEPAPGDVTVF